MQKTRKTKNQCCGHVIFRDRHLNARTRWVLQTGILPGISRYNQSMHWKDKIDVFVCPACKSPLRLIQRDGADAIQCTSTACRRVYPVRDDIPILLIDQATIDQATVEY